MLFRGSKGSSLVGNETFPLGEVGPLMSHIRLLPLSRTMSRSSPVCEFIVRGGRVGPQSTAPPYIYLSALTLSLQSLLKLALVVVMPAQPTYTSFAAFREDLSAADRATLAVRSRCSRMCDPLML
jgi:hypothetical protein